MTSKDPTSAAISVSQLNRRVKQLIEQGMTRLWVEGEISNWSQPASGHIYLSLKDTSAQVSAAWFRQRQRGPASGFKNGDRVLAYGRVSLYEPRGNYQLIIEQLQPAGEGVLKLRFDALKKKLSDEGLFDESRKQALPGLPQRIGIITSPTGAALQDILSILRRRFPLIPVIIYPAAVQGDAAPQALCDALARAVERDECDVLIAGRGGGSLEDLWAFNDEALARAIHAAPIPIVSAVGHEVDFTIADFVADVRAPTPSAAAETVVPDQLDWRRSLTATAVRLGRVGQRTLDDRGQQLDWLAKRLGIASPAATLQRQAATLLELQARSGVAARRMLSTESQRLQWHRSRLIQASPATTTQRSLLALNNLRSRLHAAIKRRLADTRHRQALLGRALHTVSPLATLERGYAIVMDEDSGAALLETQGIKSGDRIRARLAKGSFTASVNDVLSDD